MSRSSFAIGGLVAPVLAAGIISGLIAARGASAAPPSTDSFTLVGAQSPWRSEWVLALSDCTACSAKALNLSALERRIGKKSVLLALNRDDLSRLRQGSWSRIESGVPTGDFGARLMAVVPRLLHLAPDGKVIEDVPGVQPILDILGVPKT